MKKVFFLKDAAQYGYNYREGSTGTVHDVDFDYLFANGVIQEVIEPKPAPQKKPGFWARLMTR